MKKFLSFLFILFLIGCGSSDNSSQVSAAPEKTPAYPDIKDSLFSGQWYLAKNDEFYKKYEINENAHIHFGEYLGKYTGKGVTVVVTDAGLDVNHTDLKGQIKDTYNLDTNETYVGQKTEEYYHGTMTTGLIAAKANDKFIYGIAHESNVHFIKFTFELAISNEIRLFKKAEALGADIINCSWGSENEVDDAVKDVIQNLANNGRDGKGILIVFASGNEDGIPKDEPQIPEVITVGSSNAKNLRSIFSNYSSNLDIVAPGGNSYYTKKYNQQGVLVLAPDNKTDFNSGTSFSAPIVSGVLALMLEANPNLTRIQVEKILHETSDKIGRVPYNENGRNDYYGYGKINAKKAIEASLRLSQIMQ